MVVSIHLMDLTNLVPSTEEMCEFVQLLNSKVSLYERKHYLELKEDVYVKTHHRA